MRATAREIRVVVAREDEDVAEVAVGAGHSCPPRPVTKGNMPLGMLCAIGFAPSVNYT